MQGLEWGLLERGNRREKKGGFQVGAREGRGRGRGSWGWDYLCHRYHIRTWF